MSFVNVLQAGITPNQRVILTKVVEFHVKNGWMDGRGACQHHTDLNDIKNGWMDGRGACQHHTDLNDVN